MTCQEMLADVVAKEHRIALLEQQNAALRYQIGLQDAEIESLYADLRRSRGLVGQAIDVFQKWILGRSTSASA